MTNVGVHQTHCCLTHGCKYGNEECPVISGEVVQTYPCEECHNMTEETKPTASQTMTKIALLPGILEAATLLYELGLINDLPHVVVKKYVMANPDINERLNKSFQENTDGLTMTGSLDLRDKPQTKKRVGIGRGYERK